MIVYLDTGFFIDYFSKRSMVAVNLRIKSRRGRNVDQIQKESEAVMKKSGSHDLITSVVTALEYSENTFSELKKFSSGLTDITIENIIKTKSETAVFYKRCEKEGIRLIPLDSQILLEALRNPDYDELEINDAIHIQTARSNKAAIIISTDFDLLKHDRKFDNIRIVDTDDALKLF